MKLFFETAVQARVFLAALPIGLLLGLLLDMGSLLGKARIVADIAAALVAGCGLVVLSLLSMENGLQLYHLLAVIVGCLLYSFGIGRAMRSFIRRAGAFFARRRENSAARQEKDLLSSK